MTESCTEKYFVCLASKSVWRWCSENFKELRVKLRVSFELQEVFLSLGRAEHRHVRIKKSYCNVNGKEKILNDFEGS